MVVSDHSPVKCQYDVHIRGFNQTPAQKIKLKISEILMVSEQSSDINAGGKLAEFQACPFLVRLIFPAPYEDVSNELCIDILKREDSRFDSTEERDGKKIE